MWCQAIARPRPATPSINTATRARSRFRAAARHSTGPHLAHDCGRRPQTAAGRRPHTVTVVFLCDYYHPFEIGGAERSAERLAIELTARGVTVVVVTPNYGAAPAEQVRGVPVIRLRFPQRLVPGTLARRLWTGNPMLQAWYAVRVASIVRRRRAAI